ncbi:MAG: MBL fold metallo-hydrolase [Planctomycetaceae bacterium]
MTAERPPPSLTLLGTGTSVGIPVVGCRCPICTSDDPRNHRTRTGVLVSAPGGDFLIDTPPELRLQLLRENVELIHAVVYTHSHADHIYGLDDLRIFGFRLGRSIPLFCEEAVETMLRKAFSYAFEPLDPEAHHFAVPKLHFERIGLEPFELLGLTIRPLRLEHGKLPVLGFRIDDVAFCTDCSGIPEESWPLLEGLDTLVIDALRDDPHPTHFSLGQALEVVERVRPRRTYFTHVSHQLDYAATNARLPDGVELSYDGLRIPLRSTCSK